MQSVTANNEGMQVPAGQENLFQSFATQPTGFSRTAIETKLLLATLELARGCIVPTAHYSDTASNTAHTQGLRACCMPASNLTTTNCCVVSRDGNGDSSRGFLFLRPRGPSPPPASRGRGALGPILGRSSLESKKLSTSCRKYRKPTSGGD